MQSDARPPRDGTVPESAAEAVDRPESLPELIEGTLRCALRLSVSDAEVREAMRRACAVAREEGLQAERLVVALKRAWQELPEARKLLRDVREDTLFGVVTLCIKEYYAPAARSARSRNPADGGARDGELRGISP